MTENLAIYLKNNPTIDLDDIAYTLQVGRSHFQHRRMTVCAGIDEAIDRFSSPDSREVRAASNAASNRPVIFMFSGFGSEYAGMGLDLYREEPVFAREMDRCFHVLSTAMGYDLKQVLFPGTGAGGALPEETIQPLLFSFEYALARLLMQWGIKPKAMIGYSTGELVAACISGVFVLEDALQLIITRGRLVRESPDGRMLSVPLTREELTPLLSKDGQFDQLSLAIDNGPSCIVAGPTQTVAAFESRLKEKRILSMRLDYHHAHHSTLMKPVLKEFQEQVARFQLNEPRIPYISNVTGQWISPDDAVSPAYWARHLGETVQFADGINQLLKEQDALFIEIGPGRNLFTLMSRYITPDSNQSVINLIRPPAKEVSDIYYLLNKIGQLWLYGQKIHWTQCYSDENRGRVPLPSYPFERHPFWIDDSQLPRFDQQGIVLPDSTGIPSTARKPDIADWFYLPLWKRSPLPPGSNLQTGQTGQPHWLIFSANGRLSSRLIEELKQTNGTGGTVTIITPGPEFCNVNPGEYNLDPHSGDDYQRLFGELEQSGNINILYLWSIDIDEDDGAGNLNRLAKAAAGVQHDCRFQIFVITNNIREVTGDETLDPVKAVILGTAKVIPYEYPGLSCHTIDIILPEPGSAAETKLSVQLREEFNRPAPQTPGAEVAYRNRYRWKRTFEPFPMQETVEDIPKLKKKGVYLFTGQPGKIELALSEYLAQNLQAVLMIAPLGQIEETVTRLEEQSGSIDGVIHAAGDGPGAIQELLTLETLFKDRNPDFCYLSSSLAPITGGPGLAEKAAAASVADLLAHKLNRESHTHWISVNRDETELIPEEGVEVFKRILNHFSDNQIIISSLDLHARIESGPGLELPAPGDTTGQTDTSIAHQRPQLLNPYLPPSTPIQEKLTGIWKNLFGFETIGIRDDFFELGGDSLKAMNVSAKIHQALDVEIPLKEFFDRPTVEELADYISNEAVKTTFTPVEVIELREYYPVSSAQKRLFLLQQLEENTIGYNELSFLGLEGQLDKDRFQETFRQLIRRHEGLRTTFTIIGEEPVQVVHDEIDFSIEYFNLENQENTEELHAQTVRDFVRPYDLSRPPLFRVALIKKNSRKHQLVLDMHHIIIDGTSRGILIRDFMSFYDHRTGPGSFPALPVQYKEYSRWHNLQKQSRGMQKSQQYWLDIFREDIPLLNLPLDFPRPPVQRFEGASINFGLTPEITKGIDALAREADASLFMVLLAIYNVFLFKITGQQDFVIGTPISGRGHPDIESVMGVFVNTLTLRNTPRPHQPFMEFLKTVKERCLDAFQNQAYQFEDLVEQVAVDRDPGRNPLFDTMFALGNLETPSIQIPGLTLSGDSLPHEVAKFDLSLHAGTGRENDRENIYFGAEYSTRLFKKETIEKLIRYFRQTARAVSGDSSIKLAHIDIMDEVEKKEILELSNGITQEIQPHGTVHHLFEEQAARTPDRIALVYASDELSALSYGSLNKRAGQLANLLSAKGVKPGTIVALMMKRSPEVVIGMIAIMKAGGAYLPIDPDYPQERIDYMLMDSGAGVLIHDGIPRFSVESAPTTTGGVPLSRGEFAGARLIDLVEIDINDHSSLETDHAPKGTGHAPNAGSFYSPLERGGSTKERRGVSHAGNPAYIIYTSGSTGKPKGILLEHRILVNLILYQFHHTTIDFSRVLQFVTISFDVSLQEICCTLVYGGELSILSETILKDIPRLFNFIDKNHLKTLFLPASFLKFIINEESYRDLLPRHVDHIVTAGEQVVVTAAFRRYIKENRITLHNHYGPSETHIVTALTLDPSEDIPELPAIGKPIMNTCAYILNTGRCLQPAGIAGELYVGGIQVARGYLNRPELTEEKFQRDLKKEPSAPSAAHGIIYETGDLARWLPDGNIEFLGRIDHQEKIRGFRIEPGEIETQLLNHPGVREAAVIPMGGKGEQYLCAYVVPVTEDRAADPEPLSLQLREYLSRQLPDYMVPSYFISLAKIPLTPNGKVNRRALPAPETGVEGGYSPPVNETEKQLVKIWAAVLKTPGDRIGIDANFFQLGGHSLRAFIMISRIQKELNAAVSLTEIFKHPTIRQLAPVIIPDKEDIYASIAMVEEREYYPLSSAQKRMYILHQITEKSIAYNMTSVSLLEGQIHREQMDNAFKGLIQRHESLRTIFQMVGDQPVQRVHSPQDADIEIQYAVSPTQGTGNNTPAHEIIKDSIRSFDLSRLPLIRITSIRLEEKKHVLVVDMHHIISDGVSQGIFVKEFVELYGGKQLAPLGLRYKDYSQWQNQGNYHRSIKEQRQYWLTEFEGDVPLLDLPVDHARPDVLGFEGSHRPFKFPVDVLQGLKQYALREGATLFMVLTALFAIFLSKISRQETIVTGTPTAGRGHPDLEPLIGIFVNTLALKFKPSGHKRYGAFLGEVKEKALNAFANQDYQYEELVEQLDIQRDTGHNPLFDVMFVMQNLETTSVDLRDIALKPYPHESRVSKFHLTLSASETPDGLSLSLAYNTALFKEETIQRFTRYFTTLVSSVLADPQAGIWQLELITGEEKQQLLTEFNDTQREYPTHYTLHRLFEDQAQRLPHQSALVGGNPNASPVHLTYRELNRQADGLAALLREKGVETDTIVGLMAERSLEMIVGILGILKAGGAYLPIDPDYPEERVDFMLRDSASKVIVTNGLMVDGLDGLIVNRLNGSSEPTNKPINQQTNKPTNLAYLIYTSGSTGKPKGVLVEHASAVNLVTSQAHHFNILSSDRVLLFSSISFDASVEQVFVALSSGSVLVLIDRETLLDRSRFQDFLLTRSITHLHAVPSFLNHLPSDLPVGHGLRRIIAGGDVCPVPLARRLSRYCAFYNEYGPTETTVTSIQLKVGHLDENLARVPVGKPTGNTTIYLIDKWYQPVPIGLAGELLIGGQGVTRGYLNRPELTAERFIDGPFLQNGRLYRTGDLARWMGDGNIEFLGRSDRQVKVRGFRIELEEIESRLLSAPTVREAVVTIRTDQEDENYLCAYFTAEGNTEDNMERDSLTQLLAQFLTQFLPDYMIPSYFVPLDAFPLTPSGKINRQALPEPGLPVNKNAAAPRNPIEQRLAEIWFEILVGTGEPGETSIGIDDDFFQLGGHSLRATILVSKIHGAFGVKLPLMEVFRHSTIRELAVLLEGTGKSQYTSIEAVEKKDYYSLSSAQKRLYFLQRLNPQSTSYNIPFLFPIGKEVKVDRLEPVFTKLIAHHESLRSSFRQLNDIPVQRVHDVETIEFSMDRYEADKAEAEEIAKRYTRPFDLSRAPLFRSAVITLPSGHHIWLVDIHHIISDGTSSGVLTDDFLTLYSGETLPEITIQYKDFTEWQGRLFETGVIKTQMDYWFNVYPGETPRLELPTDYKRPEVFTFAGDNIVFRVDSEDIVRFRRLAARNDGTLYMNVLAVLNTLFYKYTGQTDIVIGTGIAGRPHADLQRVIGMFVNTLAMRNHPTGKKTYETLLREVIQRSVDAFENQDVQFEELVDKLDLKRDAARNPLFDIIMVVQNFQGARKGGLPEADNPQFETLPTAAEDLPTIRYKNTTSKFDMTVYVTESGEDIFINIEYYTSIFKPETIHRFSKHFQRIIKGVITDPSISLEEIEILSQEEKQVLLEQFNENQTDYPKDKTIGRLFEEQVDREPGRTAVILRDQCLTYKTLDETSNQLANYLLHESGIRPNQTVGLLMDRSLDMMIAILGILKAGGAYVPVSPTFPAERIKSQLEDASVRVLVGRKRYIKTLNRLQWECDGLDTFLCIDSSHVLAEDEVEENKLMSRKLWEYVGETAVDEVTGGGWKSSTTGNPIPKEEMDEYGDNILQKLEPLLHKETRVLEIGSASGISMFRIAPKAGFYYGTDLSPVIVQKNRQRIEEEEHSNIKVSCVAAHEIHQLEERDFDLVIINSVIQCFNGHNYLRKVIGKAVGLMKPRGHLFIGDIMDLDMKEDLIADMTAFKQANKSKDFKTKTDWSEELFISRGFLEDLVRDSQEMDDIEFSGKIHTIPNELTKFRYDALIRVDKGIHENGGNGRGERTSRVRPARVRSGHKRQHDLGTMRQFSTDRPSTPVDSGHLAYIIYTSGSTGTPKGTLTTHYNVTRVVKDTNYIRFEPGDRVLQLSDYAFDGSVFDIYGALLNGSALVLIRQQDLLELERLAGLIKREKISVFFVTTALFNILVDIGLDCFSSIRNVLFGGERVSMEHAARAVNYLGNGRVIHVYGPTETTVYATYYPIDHIDRNQVTVPIGKPIANTTAYILDTSLNPVPIGVNGEIYIGGAGVCRGYLNNEALTAEKFLPNPFREGDIIYKTGDLGRWLPEGVIEFNGRIDHQVKVRGYRIELGEIENCLLNLDEVKECTVTAREDEKGSRYLCAYIVSAPDEKPDMTELKTQLSMTLPEFMIPAYFIQLETFPLKSTGKIDQSKLPDPLSVLDESIAAPRGGLEKKLADIWSEVLGINKELIGRDSNFFELGGHSLKATVLTSQLHKELNVKVPLAEIFSSQTIAELAAYTRNAVTEKHSAIEPVEKMDYYPLSAAQNRLYFIQRMDLESTRYNMPYRIPLGKDIDPRLMENLFKELVRRHESFRTSFHMPDEIPVQRVHDCVTFEMKDFDFSRPFDLSVAPLMRAGLQKLETGEHILLVEMHHIISDGTSQEILEREFAALMAGKEPPPLTLQYKDYSQWQNSQEQRQNMKAQEHFWLERLHGELPVLNLPYDYPRPLMQRYEGSRFGFFIDREVTAALKALSLKTDATLVMVLLSALHILLSKLSGQENIITGTPIANRKHADLQDIIGMFVNTLCMRNHPAGEKSLMEFLAEVKERTLQAYENQDYPFEQLVDKASVKRDAGRHPVFDVLFNIINQLDYSGNIDDTDLDLDGIMDGGACNANFDMTFQGAEMDGAIHFTVIYCSALFNGETIKRFITYFKGILREISRGTGKPIAAIDYIPQEEKDRILVDFNRTDAEFPGEATIHGLFEDRVERNPDRIAVYGEGLSLSYRELNNASHRLAEQLNEKGVGHGTIVAVMMERSVYTVIGIMGTLKAGSAYLPIDPDYPEERTDFMLKDSGTHILLNPTVQEYQPSSSSHLPTFPHSNPSNLAYLIYTSGSTGKPKGVLVQHRSVVNTLDHLFKTYPFTNSDTYLFKTSYVFDVSVSELFGWYLGGGRLVVLESGAQKEPLRIIDTIEKHRVTHVNFVPSMFGVFLDALNHENIRRLSPV
ncbi:MAG: amino acid adenylation domain-containing protein, partial [bacterium]|nr:amino acid adenylation domain-containing protein [bacterium]